MIYFVKKFITVKFAEKIQIIIEQRHLNLQKLFSDWLSAAKLKTNLRVRKFQFFLFDAKLRFKLLASFRSADQKIVFQKRGGAVQFQIAIFNLFVNREMKCPNKSSKSRKH